MNGIGTERIQQLFQDHHQGLGRYAFTILKNQQEADDLVQQLFVTLWEKRSEIGSIENHRAYLYRAIYNRCLNEVKRSRRNHVGDEGLLEVHSNLHEVGEVLQYNDLEKRVQSAVNQLPEKCAEVFKLSRFQELSYREISEQLNISVKTVENHMTKALRVMREELKDYLPWIIFTLLFSKGW